MCRAAFGGKLIRVGLDRRRFIDRPAAGEGKRYGTVLIENFGPSGKSVTLVRVPLNSYGEKLR
jgi:hypothetical protein